MSATKLDEKSTLTPAQESEMQRMDSNGNEIIGVSIDEARAVSFRS